MGERKAIKPVYGGDNPIDSQKHKPRSKGHPHPWRDGTQLGQV
jgi:hypothetical protein